MVLFDEITRCVGSDLDVCQRLMEQSLVSRVPLAESVVHYVLDRPGKMLRPTLTLLAARVAGGEPTDATMHGAVALELLHNASLVHDDVVDQSDERRGRDSVRRVWDNRVAVLMGDFFLAKCLENSNLTGSLEVSHVLSDMVARLCEGELEQLAGTRSHMLGEEGYFSVISGKTASLFAACMRVGALTVGAPRAVVDRLSEVGERMGLVFQIRDDIFDYFPTNAAVGKPTGHDIAEGKVTLPLIYALHHASADEAATMRALLDAPRAMSTTDVMRLVDFARTVGGIDYAQARMKNIAHEARTMLATLPDSQPRQSMMQLIDYFVEREG